MPDTMTIMFFSIAATTLLLVPGPMVLYIIARSINQGRRAALTSVLAAGVGDFGHVIAATLGLSAILLTSALAFNVVKYAGVVYLIYLGIRTLLSRDEQVQPNFGSGRRLTRIFSQGVIVSALNPKTALFFLAFLPQFVNPAYGSATVQNLFLGMLFVLLGICTNNVYALIADAARSLLPGNHMFRKLQRYLAGSVYVALGITTALVGAEKSQ